MQEPVVLSLPLEEAVSRLEALGWSYECELLLPPRDNPESFQERAVRKYVVRQRALPDNKLVLTIVYR